MATSYKPEVKVFVEGATDLALFTKRWFCDPIQARSGLPLTFEEAGGCGGVCGGVDYFRATGVAAFGIVDRDALFKQKDWNNFLQPIDAVFRGAKPFGPAVFVLTCWEVENCVLANVDALAKAHSNCSGGGVSVPTTLAQLLAHADALLLVSTCLIKSHQSDATAPGFTKNPAMDAATVLREFVAHDPTFNPTTDADHVRVVAFDNSAAAPAERWRQILRILDGKRTFDRVLTLLRTRICDAEIDRLLLSLAWEGVPTEIADIVTTIRQTA